MEYNIEQITERNKVKDYGIIIGYRAQKYLLRRKRQPLWAKCGRRFLTVALRITNTVVYIPAKTIEVGMKIIIGDCDNRRHIEITAKDNISIEYEVIKEWKKEKATPLPNNDFTHF
jgi:hypothetical protein